MDVVPPSAPPGLKRDALGAGGIVFLVVSAAAPLTVMAGVAPLAISVGGIGTPAGYLAAGLVLIVFAVGFTAMTRHVSSGGAFYSYVSRGLGRAAGLAAAVVALMSYNALQIGVYGLLAAQAHASFEQLGLNVPWPVFALVAVVLVWALGYRGVDVGARVLGVLLVAEAGILLLMAIGVLARGGAVGLDLASFAPGAVFGPGMGAVLSFCFAAFMGFESTAIYRSEARDPARTIPRATYVAVVFMAVFYGFVVWAVVQAFGSAHAAGAAAAHVSDLFYLVTTDYVGAWASDLMRVLIITSVYASQLAFHNAINRYAYSLAGDGALPAWVGAVHPRHGSPYRAGLVQSALAVVIIGAFAVAGADPYSGLLLQVNTPGVIGIIALQALTSAAVAVFFLRRQRGLVRRGTVVAAVVATVLLSAATVVLADSVDLLSNAGPVVNTFLVGMVPATFLLGLVLAWRLRSRRPEVYERIGGGGGETVVVS
ncbi:APC family permease [Pseudonocardia acaciae]|uniref:APC family permease n=1 Tax=Pseudonocardia acaciae TaxID=551276 RepID=UPI00048B214B|nr:APC family permease [Pseudonocardia acaciae]